MEISRILLYEKFYRWIKVPFLNLFKHFLGICHGILMVLVGVFATDLFFFNFILFYFLRKISPELTSSANPPLFAEETGPELTSVPIFLYFICGMSATARLDKRCHVRTWDPNRWTPGRQSRTCTLNRCAKGLASLCIDSMYILYIYA